MFASWEPATGLDSQPRSYFLALTHCSVVIPRGLVGDSVFFFLLRCQGLGLSGKILFTALALSAERRCEEGD